MTATVEDVREKLHSILASGQWTVWSSMSGHYGPHECKEFFLSHHGGLQFVHGSHCHLYFEDDQVLQLNRNECIIKMADGLVHHWIREEQ